jgi:hypothetical protein
MHGDHHFPSSVPAGHPKPRSEEAAVPAPRPLRRLATVGAALLLAAGLLLGLAPSPAAAVVTPLHGYRATVDGVTSWYGSYGMAGLGTAWCIDHGIRAPDPAFAYRAADLSAVPTTTRTAMAWVLGRYAFGTDRVRHAAVMLTLHDLMGALYPSGRLDVDRLTVSRLAGFGGREASVLVEARRLKAEGMRHAHLRGPLTMRVRVGAVDGRGALPIAVSVVDSAGRAVVGLPVALEIGAGGSLAAPTVTTGADGTARTFARPVRLPLTVRASALAPRPGLDAWAPTTRPAQRVARPSVAALHASASREAPPSTTTTLPPTTTTTSTTTTSTIPPATTTTVGAATTTSTLGVPAVATPTTSTSTPPETVLSAPPSVPTLPRTGGDAVALAALGLGLVLLGAAAVELRRE